MLQHQAEWNSLDFRHHGA